MAEEVVTKKWYLSKTLWVNLIAMLVGVVGASSRDIPPIDPEVQVGMLAFINLILRVLTKSGIQA